MDKDCLFRIEVKEMESYVNGGVTVERASLGPVWAQLREREILQKKKLGERRNSRRQTISRSKELFQSDTTSSILDEQMGRGGFRIRLGTD